MYRRGKYPTFGGEMSEIIPWIVNIIFVGAFIPQIFLNYRVKSTRGLSDLYLLGYLNGYVINFAYVYCLDFPMAYKFMAPMAVLCSSILIFQRFWYTRHQVFPKSIRLYGIDFAFLFFLIPFFVNYPIEAGHIAGWALLIIWITYQLPQLLRIYKNRSVEGFSFLLVTMIGFGNLFELVTSIIFNLPVQTFLTAIRGIVIYAIFCFQFWYFGQKNQKSLL